MMIDGRGILLLLAILAFAGFCVGALASIWLGPIAMLYGAIGVPSVFVLVVIAALLISAALQ